MERSDTGSEQEPIASHTLACACGGLCPEVKVFSDYLTITDDYGGETRLSHAEWTLAIERVKV